MGVFYFHPGIITGRDRNCVIQKHSARIGFYEEILSITEELNL